MRSQTPAFPRTAVAACTLFPIDRHPGLRRASVLLLLALLATGCGGSLRNRNTGSQPDRLQDFYTQLHTGRFAVIADFENLAHYQLFHTQNSSGEAQPVPTNTAGVPETGRKALQVTLAGGQDALIVSGDSADDWTLPRDWREYHLLLAAVYSPAADLPLDLTVVAGPSGRQQTATSRQRLRRGWNALSLDLADVARSIPVDDVRELRFSLPEADRPTKLVLDDLILADNRETLFGESEDDGALYVQRSGRQLHIGADGRFELGFANAQVVHWYDLTHDPQRLRNLVDGGLLGPYPAVRMPGGSELVQDFSALGDTVVAHQQVVEANPVRVIVNCTLRFTTGRNQPDASSPFQRWIYTIYRSGHVFVTFEATTQYRGWAPQSMALIVTRTGIGPSLRTFAYPPASPGEPDRPPYVAYALARPDQAGLPGMLFTLRPDDRPVSMTTRESGSAIELIAESYKLAGPTDRWHCLLRIWPANAAGPAQAETAATQFCHPAPPRLDVGQIDRKSVV